MLLNPEAGDEISPIRWYAAANLHSVTTQNKIAMPLSLFSLWGMILKHFKCSAINFVNIECTSMLLNVFFV
jgi:hypothetical protein